MNKLATLWVLLFCLLGSVASAERSTMATPEGTDLMKYPIMSGVLSPQKQASLNLRPMILKESWTGYNWYRDKQRFIFETLPAGTLVLADENGTPIYKASCGNRLAGVKKCPVCNSLAETKLLAPVQLPQKGFLDKLWDFVKDVWKLVGGLALLALALALLALLIYLLYRGLRALSQSSDDSRREDISQQYRVDDRQHRTAMPTASPIPPGYEPEERTRPSSATSPSASAPEKRFIAIYFGGDGNETKIKQSGFKEIVFEQAPEGAGASHTVKFRA